MTSDRSPFIRSRSYWHGKLNSRGDIDGGAGCSFCGPGFTDKSFPGFIPFAAQSQDNVPSLDQFTQEVRVASNNSTGSATRQASSISMRTSTSKASIWRADPRPTPSAIVNQHQDSEALGIFGSVNYKFDSGLTLQAGAR